MWAVYSSGIAAAGIVDGLLMLPYRSRPTRSSARFADVDPAAVEDHAVVSQEPEVADPVR